MEDHKEHGRGTEEYGPYDSDCPCRGSILQKACAAGGCGFCQAAESMHEDMDRGGIGDGDLR